MSKVTRADTNLEQFIELLIIADTFDKFNEFISWLKDEEHNLVYVDSVKDNTIRIVVNEDEYNNEVFFAFIIKKLNELGIYFIEMKEVSVFFPKLPDNWNGDKDE